MRKTHIAAAAVMCAYLFMGALCGPGTPSQAFIDDVIANCKGLCQFELSNPVQTIVQIVSTGNAALQTVDGVVSALCQTATAAVAPTATDKTAAAPNVGGVPIHGTINGKKF
jgi:hypothetical protein